MTHFCTLDVLLASFVNYYFFLLCVSVKANHKGRQFLKKTASVCRLENVSKLPSHPLPNPKKITNNYIRMAKGLRESKKGN